MPGPKPSYAVENFEEEHQPNFYRKRKPRKRNVDNELRKVNISVTILSF